MLRAIAAVIVGYIVMAALTMLLFSILFLALGVERTFEPGTYNATMAWNVSALAISVLNAIAGGFVCRKIAKSGTPPIVLAVLIFGLGLMVGIQNLSKPDPGPRGADVSVIEAASKTKQPNWYGMTIPFVGAVGVMIGAALAQRKK